MRRIMYIALGFAAACVLSLYADDWVVRGIGLGLILLISAFAERKPGAVRRCAAALLGSVFGFVWFGIYQARYIQPIAPLNEEEISCIIRAADYGRETDYGTAFTGTLILEEKSYRVTAYLQDSLTIEPGDIVSGSFRLKVTTESPSAYYPGKGIFLLAYPKADIAISGGNPTSRDFPAVLRHRIQNLLEYYLPPDCTAFAQALLLGDTSGLSYETDTHLKVSGIRHVVAVSGLHVSVFFAVLSAITFRRRFLSGLLGIPLLFLFAAVAGFTPSVTRACIMTGLMLTAQMLNREYDGPSALSFAVLCMLIGNPYTIGSVSFQLSVAGVSGIFLFASGMYNGLTKKIEGKQGRGYGLLRKLAGIVSVTLSVQVFTIPLCAYYFGVVSLVGCITNLLVLWMISLIFLLLICICAASLAVPPLASLLGTVAGWLIRYVLFVAKQMAAFPMAAVYTVSPYVVLWLVFLYILLTLYFFLGKKQGKILLCVAVLSLCIAQMASWIEVSLADVRFTVLDVGQGQCLLLQSGGHTYVVDCGGENDRKTADLAAETLLSQGISRIDGLILTHTDRDHAGGVEHFLSRTPTAFLITPRPLEAIQIPKHTRCVLANQDLLITDGAVTISVYAPLFQGAENEMSLCVLFDTQKCDILITGDRNAFGERTLLRNAEIPKVDVLVAGHHGSRHSNSRELLDAVRPEIVCISAGKNNPYGHPAPEVLSRFEKYGSAVYRTDLHGTITIRR